MSRKSQPFLQFRHWGGLEGGKEAASAFGAPFGKYFKKGAGGNDDLGRVFLGGKTTGAPSSVALG